MSITPAATGLESCPGPVRGTQIRLLGARYVAHPRTCSEIIVATTWQSGVLPRGSVATDRMRVTIVAILSEGQPPWRCPGQVAHSRVLWLVRPAHAREPFDPRKPIGVIIPCKPVSHRRCRASAGSRGCTRLGFPVHQRTVPRPL